MTDLDLDQLLDQKLDDIDDVPTFKNYIPGAYEVKVNMEAKKVGTHPAVEVKLTHVNTIALVDENAPEEDQPQPGDESSALYMLDNEFGAGFLKQTTLPIAEALGVESIRQVIEGCVDIECSVVTGIRVDKNDKTKEYLEIAELAVN